MNTALIYRIVASFLLCFGFATPALASDLKDVQLLSVIPGKEQILLKLHAQGTPADSYFTLMIPKGDPRSFEKAALVMKKMILKDAFRLNLAIPSFSASPSGSRYGSEDVVFSGDGPQ